jgi:hypothetical protein
MDKMPLSFRKRYFFFFLSEPRPTYFFPPCFCELPLTERVSQGEANSAKGYPVQFLVMKNRKILSLSPCKRPFIQKPPHLPFFDLERQIGRFLKSAIK